MFKKLAKQLLKANTHVKFLFIFLKKFMYIIFFYIDGPNAGVQSLSPYLNVDPAYLNQVQLLCYVLNY